MTRWTEPLLRRLRGARGPLWLAALALLFTLPALRLSYQMDDHWLRLNHARELGPFGMLGSARDGEVREAKLEGGVAWWANDALRLRFFRPLSSLSHHIDFASLQLPVQLMHLVNMMLYALLVGVAATTYRALASVADQGRERGSATAWLTSAVLAGLMYALDDGHAPSAGWISGRNTLLANLFGLASVLAYVRAFQGSKLARWLGPLAFGLGLLSAEAGVQALAYLVAFALVLDPGPGRWRRLTPHVVLVVSWAAYYTSQGYGVRGSDWYRDPWTDPLHTLAGAAWDLPLWLGSQFVISFASASLFAPETLARVIWLCVLAALAPALLWVARASRLARFHALGSLLTLLPLALTRPQDRLLLAASFGAFGLIALSLAAGKASDGDGGSRYLRINARALAVLHLGLAPLLFVPGLGNAEPIERSARALAKALPTGGAADGAIVLNLPLEILMSYARSQRLADGSSLPPQSYLLYAGSSPLEVTRVDARTLELYAIDGFCRSPFERFLTTLRPGYRAGQSWSLRGMQVRIERVNAQRAPELVRVTFSDELDAPRRAWLTWRGRGPEPWPVPAVGETVRVEARSPLSSLSR